MQDKLSLTLPELAEILDPPVSLSQLRLLVTALRLRPSGYRRDGKPGRPLPCYDSSTIMRVHAANIPWLAVAGVLGPVSG
jgi:hypothetical protein